MGILLLPVATGCSLLEIGPCGFDGDLIGGEGSMEDLITPEMVAEAEKIKAGLGIEDNQSEAYRNPKGIQ